MFPSLEMLPSEDIENLPAVVLHNHVAAIQEENLRLEQALLEATSLLQSFIDSDGDEDEKAEVIARAEQMIENFSIGEASF